MKRNLFVLIAIFVCACSFAQGEIDALRLSGTDLQGTARGQAMGGAFGALGGDVTGILINPAGLGVYRSSEVNATLSVASTNIKTNWNGSTETQDRSKFNFDNISYVGYFPTGNDKCRTINFGFTYNRLKNFDRKYSASATGLNSSLTDYIAKITNGVYYEDLYSNENSDPYDSGIPWLSVLGWDGYLINDTDDYEYSGLFSDESTNPSLRVSERGRIESYDFSLGTNISDVLYLGATFSIMDISYHLYSSFDEKYELGGSIGLDNDLETQGDGIQLKVGAIWRPIDALRIGVAYHSPTWYSLTDYYQGNTYADYEDIHNKTARTPDGAYTNYRFHTPDSWVFSVAGILGTKAVVSLDYELKNYSGMYLNEDYAGNRYSETNKFMDKAFNSTASTIRAGLEYRFTPQLSGRVGYSWMQNPYKESYKDQLLISGTIPHYTVEGDVNYFTAGIGYRFTPQFYVDATFVYKTQTDVLYGYPLVFNNSEPASLKSNTSKGLVTLGYKF
ncbi:MAG: outer membrane protein transport protein [Candidatus Symbiothrix sp.]|jgi:long-subunit fatty acid transport protein|nr:outer membrane protein transport protein [Candidatus Symbiothrix sp.]